MPLCFTTLLLLKQRLFIQTHLSRIGKRGIWTSVIGRTSRNEVEIIWYFSCCCWFIFFSSWSSPAGEEVLCWLPLREGVGGSQINLFVSSCFLLVKISLSLFLSFSLLQLRLLKEERERREERLWLLITQDGAVLRVSSVSHPACSLLA